MEPVHAPDSVWCSPRKRERSWKDVITLTLPTSQHWPIRLSAYSGQGAPKQGEIHSQDIAGPLCFAGDMIGTERELPLIEPGDVVVMHDTGAYYFSIPFYYNSLPAPAVYGVEWRQDEPVGFRTWRQQQSLDQTLEVIG